MTIMKKYIKPELIIVETETQNLMEGSVNFDPTGNTTEVLAPDYGEFNDDLYE